MNQDNHVIANDQINDNMRDSPVQKLLQWCRSNITTIIVIAFISARVLKLDYTLVPSESMSTEVSTGDFVLFDKFIRSALVALPLFGKFFYDKYSYNPEYDQYILSKIKRGDTILFTDGKDNYIKRAIGMPGDEIEFNEFDIIVNGVSTLFANQDHSSLFAEPEKVGITHDDKSKEIVYRLKSQVPVDADTIAEFNTYYSYKLNNKDTDFDYFAVRQRAPYRKMKVPAGYVFVRGNNRDHSHDSAYGMFVKVNSIIGKALYRLIGTGKRFGNYDRNETLIHMALNAPLRILGYVMHLKPGIRDLRTKHIKIKKQHIEGNHIKVTHSKNSIDIHKLDNAKDHA